MKFNTGDKVLVPFQIDAQVEYHEGTIINLYIPVKTGKKGRPRIDMIVVVNGEEYQVTRKEVKPVKKEV